MTFALPASAQRVPTAPSALTEAIERLGTRMTFDRGVEIYAQDDPVELMYRLVSGVVRTTRFAADGRRQIGDFYYAGDVFGVEPGPDHQFAAEALTDCETQLVRRATVRAFAGDAELDRAIVEAARHELRRMQDHVLLLGRKTAREKVAGFLKQLADAEGAQEVSLPMGRQDMADYLGLTIETVSRMLTQLQSDAIVEFPSLRRFHVKKWNALESIAA